MPPKPPFPSPDRYLVPLFLLMGECYDMTIITKDQASTPKPPKATKPDPGTALGIGGGKCEERDGV